ncbi:tRNA (guanosine(37)-N1)-methyltransferase TrmD [Buchnera aphidicola (Muscaphis stroyani)]|uniref:tRNA (guanine-N(1)-)-methyltransferase n=2 Tax=Buchnera aphidicola TaxID=9 RepID=A0A4D6YCZ6_9GAMM|nr:tRNA (guanosine(37)-N1)-methyltransferase TrmD [Buchnera aphidicola (Muscaphis stroyani)]
MWFEIITIFPEMFQAITDYGVTGKAIKKNIIHINLCNLRNFSKKKYKSIDDRPYGGGSGMLMSFQPLYKAIQHVKSKIKNAIVIYLSPQGTTFKQEKIPELIKRKKIIFVCGRYEGIDQRIIDDQIDEEWSIGDYVLTGGELAGMIIIDSISRFLPGVVHKKESVEKDSFSKYLLDYPHYTRPETIKNMKVPSVLLSGHHDNIRIWRLQESLRKTWIKRPDLLKKKTLTQEEKSLLNDFKKKLKKNN